jgi:hypothetical protein
MEREAIMPVNVCLPLFGNPGRELEEGSAVRGKQLRDLGDDLQKRLQQAGDTLDKLLAAGWSASQAMFDVILLHPEVRTREEALKRLQELGVEPGSLMIIEEVDEGDTHEQT